MNTPLGRFFTNPNETNTLNGFKQLFLTFKENNSEIVWSEYGKMYSFAPTNFNTIQLP